MLVLHHMLVSAYLYFRDRARFLAVPRNEHEVVALPGPINLNDDETPSSTKRLDRERIGRPVASCSSDKDTMPAGESSSGKQRRISRSSLALEAVLQLASVGDFSSLRNTVKEAVVSLMPDVEKVIFYLWNKDSQNLFTDDIEQHEIPEHGIVRLAVQCKKDFISRTPLRQTDPACHLLKHTQNSGNNKVVICSPVLDETSNRVIAVIVVSCSEFGSLQEKQLGLLKRHIAASWRRLINGRRSSYAGMAGIEDQEHAADILALCAELYDQDARKLQLKLVNYLQKHTSAQCGFLMLVAEDTGTLFCQVIGDKVIEEDIKYPSHCNSFSSVLDDKKPISLDDISQESRNDISSLLGFDVHSMLCVPVIEPAEGRVIALACVVNKIGASRFTEDDIKVVQTCFKYTTPVLTSTLAFQKERMLKNQTQTLLHVAKNLFTHLGEYSLSAPCEESLSFPVFHSGHIGLRLQHSLHHDSSSGLDSLTRRLSIIRKNTPLIHSTTEDLSTIEESAESARSSVEFDGKSFICDCEVEQEIKDVRPKSKSLEERKLPLVEQEIKDVRPKSKSLEERKLPLVSGPESLHLFSKPHEPTMKDSKEKQPVLPIQTLSEPETNDSEIKQPLLNFPKPSELEMKESEKKEPLLSLPETSDLETKDLGKKEPLFSFTKPSKPEMKDSETKEQLLFFPEPSKSEVKESETKEPLFPISKPSESETENSESKNPLFPVQEASEPEIKDSETRMKNFFDLDDDQSSGEDDWCLSEPSMEMIPVLPPVKKTGGETKRTATARSPVISSYSYTPRIENFAPPPARPPVEFDIEDTIVPEVLNKPVRKRFRILPHIDTNPDLPPKLLHEDDADADLAIQQRVFINSQITKQNKVATRVTGSPEAGTSKPHAIIGRIEPYHPLPSPKRKARAETVAKSPSDNNAPSKPKSAKHLIEKDSAGSYGVDNASVNRIFDHVRWKGEMSTLTGRISAAERIKGDLEKSLKASSDSDSENTPTEKEPMTVVCKNEAAELAAGTASSCRDAPIISSLTSDNLPHSDSFLQFCNDTFSDDSFETAVSQITADHSLENDGIESSVVNKIVVNVAEDEPVATTAATQITADHSLENDVTESSVVNKIVVNVAEDEAAVSGSFETFFPPDEKHTKSLDAAESSRMLCANQGIKLSHASIEELIVTQVPTRQRILSRGLLKSTEFSTEFLERLSRIRSSTETSMKRSSSGFVIPPLKCWPLHVVYPGIMFRSIENKCQQFQCIPECFPVNEDVTLLLKEIMQEARHLTQAERCSLFLLDRDQNELVAKVFDGDIASQSPSRTDVSAEEKMFSKITPAKQREMQRRQEMENEVRIPANQGIAGHVATTGQLLNIRDAYSHPLFYRGVDDSTGFKTRNILCFPIRDEKGVIGIAELCNKINGAYFTQFDEEIATAFSVYCGLSIVHSLMYRKVWEAQHRSHLANELMMYHMKVTEPEYRRLTTCDVKHPEEYGEMFTKFCFLPRSLSTEDSLSVANRERNIGSIYNHGEKGYRDVPYHNWFHAFAVTHFCYLLYKNLPLLDHLTEMEVFALFVACMCHDLDHRGTNNSFQVTSKSILAALYSSEGSVMERHHFSQAMCIINMQGSDIFENLSSKEYQQVLDLMRDIILATDLSHHLVIMPELEAMAKCGYQANNPKHHKLLLCLLMTSCDLSDQTKSWSSTKKIAEQIYHEFFSQGDLEKAMGNKPLDMMDREKACIPQLQINFLQHIAIPLYGVLTQIFPPCWEVEQQVAQHQRSWAHVQSVWQKKRTKTGTSLDIFADEELEKLVQRHLSEHGTNSSNGRIDTE